MINIDRKYQASNGQSMLSRYHRAEEFEHEAFKESLVLNSQIFPHWIGDRNCFWYIRKHRDNETNEVIKSYRLVNANTAKNSLAFDHALLAQCLSFVADRKVDSENLPISQLKIELSPTRLTFFAFERYWLFDTSTESCEASLCLI